jgi:altronate dehydratase small subunit
MRRYAKLIDAQDNVATAVADVEAGEMLTIQTKSGMFELQVNETIPFGHKIALKDIKQGEGIVKYGKRIGSASQNIQRGDWVHTHNVKDDYKVLGKNGEPLPGQEE